VLKFADLICSYAVHDRDHYNFIRSDDPHFDKRLPLEADDAEPFAVSTSEDEPDQEISKEAKEYLEEFMQDERAIRHKKMRARAARFEQKVERELQREQANAENQRPSLPGFRT